MKFFIFLFHVIWKTLWYSFAAVIVLTATVFSIARLLLPTLGDYSVSVENYFSQFVNQPIKIQSLDAEWRGWGPSLVLNNVRLLETKSKNTIVRISKANLGLGLWETLKSRQLAFSSLDLQGVDLSITRLADGHITMTGFEMLKSVDTEISDDTFLRDWLLKQGRIGVQFRNLIYEDRMAGGRKYHFSDVSLSARNRGEHHLIEGWVGIPKQSGQKMTIFIDARGDLLQSDQWSGKMYFSGHKINIINLVNSFTPAAQKFTVGPSDFEIWSHWDKAKLLKMQGTFALEDLAVKQIPGDSVSPAVPGTLNAVQYQGFGGRFVWQRQDAGWQLNADQITLENQNQQWPASRLSLNYKPAVNYPSNENDRPTQNQGFEISAEGSFLRAQDLTPLLKTLVTSENQTINFVQNAEAKFDIHNYSVKYTASAQPQFDFAGDITDFQAKPYQQFPGIKKLAGRVRFDETAGYVVLDARNALLDMPQLFRHKIILNELQGKVAWEAGDSAYYITGRNLHLRNSESTLDALLDVEIPTGGRNAGNQPDQSPFVNLIARFANVDGSTVPRKIPARIMSAPLVEWLDRAIVAGHVPSGNLVFHGKTNDFPFQNHDGVFKVKFAVQDAILDYGAGWPRMEDLDADLEFNGPRLTVKSNKGTILHSPIHNTVVTISDLGRKPLQIHIAGDVSGKSQDKVDYVLRSPTLRKKLGQFFEDVEITGDSNLHVAIDLYVAKDDVDAQVNGNLQLTQNTIKYLWFGDALTAVNGKINIVPHGINARGIKADFYSQPSLIDINTIFDKQTKEPESIEIIADGNFDSHDLSKRYLPVLSDLVDGTAAWNVVTNIPVNDRPELLTNREQPIRFVAKSSLLGVEVRLPTPFNKRAEQHLPTTIEGMLYTGSNYLFRTSYGNRFDSVVEYSEAGEDVWRGEIRFGRGPVELPKEEGIRLVGHLQEMSVDVWRSLISQVGEEHAVSGANPNGPPKEPIDWAKLFHSADLTIDRFELFGQEAKNMDLNMTDQEQAMLLKVNSDELKGEISLPYDLQRDPLILNLDRWELTSSGEGRESIIDPRELPAIKAVAKSVSYKNRKFGSVRLDTTKIVEGLRLEQLIVKPRSTTILANGKWVWEGGEQRSQFELHLQSANLGETMDDLDYIGSISGGKGRIDANISWPGALTDVAVDHLQGDVAIDFKDGKLLAVDSGAGRIFGLFSFQTLPKRLLLDFSDLYEKGVVFNEIAGNFTIEDGDAYTNNFHMAGPGAKAKAAGRIGLAARDYDQLLTFTPQTADIASLVGLIFSTPWGFVIPQIFKENINKAMSFQYTLNGSWDNPQLERLIKAEPIDLIGEQ